ncbi:hypothetical protein J8I26_12735 [Herbaspirillum sp. LeCh32-8]|uniref:hypothetical protein n=1 Tax=Herbaspirillum sp. LeCh32-8 TaxID=2821356 RepID=UPI001AE44A3C|nr:hypothetical protein [Herbaspirillum sp. LeCh32-8]MBP0598980.1 hypothetical protein [Herbaspirillum sp. LeCh32-8]
MSISLQDGKNREKTGGNSQKFGIPENCPADHEKPSAQLSLWIKVWITFSAFGDKWKSYPPSNFYSKTVLASYKLCQALILFASD